MNDALSKRQAAIRLRVAGESIPDLWRAVQRMESWFHTWWKRYLTLGPEGLYDLTRANNRVIHRIPPPVERAVSSMRRRRAARTTPPSRYTFVGAPQPRAELAALGYTPWPSLRTSERIVTRAGVRCPSRQRARPVAQTEYPGPKAHETNQLPQVDRVGPHYLKGDATVYDFLVLRDPFALAVSLECAANRQLDRVLAFRGRAWQQLGLPHPVQFDNGSEFCGFGSSADALSRVIRFALRLGIEPVFIPEGCPQPNGSVEQLHGWFQPRLLNRAYRRPAEVRRELRRLMTSVNAQHVQPHLGQRTSAQYRRSKRLRKLPADFQLDGHPLPIAVGKGRFIRLGSAQGRITVLEQPFHIGQRDKFQYVKATLCTRSRTLKVYSQGRLVKELPYKLTG
jgi:transposase InsO family protein